MTCAILFCGRPAKSIVMPAETRLYICMDMKPYYRCEEHSKEAPWPKPGDHYCRITSQGKVVTHDVVGAKTPGRAGFMGIFRTKEEAQERLEKIKEFLATL